MVNEEIEVKIEVKPTQGEVRTCETDEMYVLIQKGAAEGLMIGKKIGWNFSPAAASDDFL